MSVLRMGDVCRHCASLFYSTLADTALPEIVMYSELYAISYASQLPSDERELPILGSGGGLGAGAPARLQ